MHSHDHLIFFLEIIVLLGASRLLGEAFRLLRQPAVVGELLAGVILGPTLLGSLAPEAHRWLFPAPEGNALPPTLDAFTLLCVTLLMLAAGLEVDLRLVARETRATAYCAVFGSVVPLAFGLGAGLLFAGAWGKPDGVPAFAFALVLGINLAMSALPIIARTLLDLGIYRSRVGVVILSSAMIDDLSVWLLFSVAMGLSGGPHGEASHVTAMVLSTIALLVGSLTVGRWVLNRVIPVVQARFSFPGSAIALTVVFGLGMASIALWIGIHPVFGSLLAGVVIGSVRELREETRTVVYEFVVSVFAPIFFASIGLRMDFAANFDVVLVLGVLALGCTGKGLGAWIGGRLGGLDRRESLAVAAGLNSRGIMGIVLGIVALEYGVIENRMFVALAVLGVSTSLMSGPLMKWALRLRGS